MAMSTLHYPSDNKLRRLFQSFAGGRLQCSSLGLGGLGTFIYQGVQSSNNALILLGAVPAALLAFLLGGLIDLLQKHVVPKGLRKGGGDA